MFNFGCYYYDIEDYEQMKKYYLMAIKKGDIANSMNGLELYYQDIEDYE